MKKIKHITINIDVDAYNMIIKLAKYHRRNNADFTRLVLLDGIDNLWIEYQNAVHKENKEGLKDAIYKPLADNKDK